MLRQLYPIINLLVIWSIAGIATCSDNVLPEQIPAPAKAEATPLIQTKKVTVLTGVRGLQQFGDFLVTEDTTASIQFTQATALQINTEAANVSVRFSDIKRGPVSPLKVSNTQYLITSPGDTWVDVTCVDFAKNIFVMDQVVVSNGPVVPPTPPNPGPTPPNPGPSKPLPDSFENLAKRVNDVSAKLPNTSAVAAAYLASSKSLASNPRTTIDDESKTLAAALVAVPEYSSYKEFSNLVNSDLSKRWPLSRGVLADYWKTIAIGLNPSLAP